MQMTANTTATGKMIESMEKASSHSLMVRNTMESGMPGTSADMVPKRIQTVAHTKAYGPEVKSTDMASISIKMMIANTTENGTAGKSTDTASTRMQTAANTTVYGHTIR